MNGKRYTHYPVGLTPAMEEKLEEELRRLRELLTKGLAPADETDEEGPNES